MTTVHPTPGQTETVLRDVVQTLIDGHKGFSKAAESLDEDGYPELAQKMRDFAEQRQRMSVALREAAMKHFSLSDVDGSTGGDLHRLWMSLADSATGEDPHTVLAIAEQGEDHAKEVFESALDEDLPEDLRELISRQASEVFATHDEVRDLRDAHNG